GKYAIIPPRCALPPALAHLPRTSAGACCMSVTRRLLVLGCALLLLQVASTVRAQSITRLSGLGYLDYRSKPRFKVGDWVKYHFSSRTDDGKTEDHDMTILISGEEPVWGDDCFWIETWAGGRTLTPQA